MLSAKQGNIWYHFYNLFGMTRSGIEPTTTRSRGERSNHWATAAVCWECVGYFLYFFLIQVRDGVRRVSFGEKSFTYTNPARTGVDLKKMFNMNLNLALHPKGYHIAHWHIAGILIYRWPNSTRAVESVDHSNNRNLETHEISLFVRGIL